MDVEVLSERRATVLKDQRLTYDAVGQAIGEPPPGYGHFSRTRLLPVGRTFERAVHELMAWQVQARSGLRVSASSLHVEVDAVVVMRAGVGLVSVAAPCKVVTVVDEADRRGFAYGTLPGHPESGEEAFILERQADDRVVFTVSAFSRPATTLARLGGPITARIQQLMINRYLRSLD